MPEKTVSPAPGSGHPNNPQGETQAAIGDKSAFPKSENLQSFIVVDVGSSWTKLFITSVSKGNVLNIDQTYKLPTSRGKIDTTLELLLSRVSDKNYQKIFVSKLEGVEHLAKKEKALFVEETKASKNLVEFLKKQESEVVILDAGASIYGRKLEAEKIGRYLSFTITDITLENMLGNKSFRIHYLPKNLKELEIEEAVVRSAFENEIKDGDKKKLLITVTGGVFSGTPEISRSVLLILDILPDGGVAEVLLDREFFLPSFGALLAEYKQMSMVSPGKWLDRLGSFMSLGKPVDLKLDWGYSQLQEVELTQNEISSIPASLEQEIKVTYKVTEKEKRVVSVTGGSVGLILDARNKPLPLSFGQKISRDNMLTWLKALEESKLNEEVF